MSAVILVVDDEPGMRSTLVDILEAAGYTVAAASDGATAITMAHGRSFDLILTDIRMPGATGVEVLASIDQRPPQVILMTGYALDEELSEARANGAFAIVQKPFQVTYLLRVVAEAVAE